MLGSVPVWPLSDFPELHGDLGGTGLILIAQLDFFPHLSDRSGTVFDLRRAVPLGWFVIYAFRSFQSVSQVLPLGGPVGDGPLQALAVGLQVRDGFDLAVAQKGGFCDLSVQLENFSTQKVGRSLDALEVVPVRAQQNAILEVQGWEASELFRRLPGHFVTAFSD